MFYMHIVMSMCFLAIERRSLVIILLFIFMHVCLCVAALVAYFHLSICLFRLIAIVVESN